MSNFSEITVHFLIEGINLVKSISEKKDNSYSNRAFTLFRAGRNIELSSKKRTALTQLITKLEEILTNNEDREYDDKAMLDLFKQAIVESRNNISTLSLSHTTNDGTTTDALLTLENLAELIYEKSKEIQLLDLKDNKSTDDPMTYFHYYAMKFCAQNVYNRIMRDYIIQDSLSFSITRIGEISDILLQNQRTELSKQTYLCQAIQDCQNEIDVMQKDHIRFKQTKLECVMRYINTVRTQFASANSSSILHRVVLWTDYLESYMEEAYNGLGVLAANDEEVTIEFSEPGEQLLGGGYSAIAPQRGKM